MGMPGSETALEEMMCRVLGDLIQEGCVAKLADDLYCGGDSPKTLLSNWRRVLEALDRCNLRLSPAKYPLVSSPPSHPTLPDMNDKPPVTPAVFPALVHPMLAPPAPPELITIPSDEEQVPSFTSDDPPLNITSSSPAPVAVQEESSTSVAATDQPLLSPPNFPALPDSRPQRQRRPPSYLQDYVRF